MPEHTELTWLLCERHGARRAATACTSSATSRRAQRELVSAGLLFYPVLRPPTCSPTARTRCRSGEDQREHLELMRDVARALQRALRRGRPRRARAPHPEVGARMMRPAGARRARCRRPAGSEQGTVYVLDEPDGDREEVQARGHRLRQRDRRARRQAGHLEPDRDPRRRPRRSTPEAGRSRVRATRAATATSRPPSAEAVVEWLAPVRERYEELRADEARARGDPRRRRREGAARSRGRDARRRARAHGRRAVARVRRRRIAVRGRMQPSPTLELDLDVFAARSTCC